MTSKSAQYVKYASIILVVLGAVLVVKNISNQTYLQAPSFSEVVLEPAAAATLPRSAPVRLRIPDIAVDVPFVELGLDANNEIEVPAGYEEVGWYVHGPTPGELGPAVVLGHVDSHRGPAVFFSLGQLEPGDIIEIGREDGTTAIFRVDRLERYLQSNFPTSLVYGNIGHAGLRLITCSGSYDRESERYDSNLVVYASLLDSR